MPAFDWSIITALAPYAATLAAVVAPVITTVCTTRSQERSKNMEMYSPRVYDALDELAKTYSYMTRCYVAEGNQAEQERLYLSSRAKYENFMTACHKLLSLVPGADVQQKIFALLTAIRQDGFFISPKHDEQFLALLSSVNSYMLTLRAKK